MSTEGLRLAPSYLLKPYSSLTKSTYHYLLRAYYHNGCKQHPSTNLIMFFYGSREHPLKESDCSLQEAQEYLKDNNYSVYSYYNPAWPKSFRWFDDIVFCEKGVE